MSYNQEVGLSKPRTGAPKRVAVGLLAGSLAMFGVAFAPSAGATATVTSERLAGATRYGTAAAIAGDEAFATPSHVIIATGENFPDALAASTLSGARGEAPILLTETARLTQETSAGLDSLRAKGVNSATIVGGTQAVSQATQTAIAAKGFTVTRVAGTDRYETASAIATAADAIQDSGSVGGQKTALVATGLNFPDALAGGPAAVANDLPLLLVNQGVPASTRATLQSLGITRVIILGGTAAVSEAVATELGTIVGTAPTRLAGTDRYLTAVAIANYEITTLGFAATSAILATGDNFPDALAAGPLGGKLRAPIVLTVTLPSPALPEASRAFLDAQSSTIAKLYVAGGTAVITDQVVAAAVAAAQTIANDGPRNTPVTARPELVTATIVSTTTAAQATAQQPAGTVVRYTFDEAVGNATAGNFLVYTQAGAPGTPGNAIVTNTTGDNTSVLVRFDNFTTAAAASQLSVAAVTFAAVTGAGGFATDTNPEGDAPIGSSGQVQAQPGRTAAPDLDNVTNPRQQGTASGGLPGDTVVDFTFDQSAFVVNPNGFHLVLTSPQNPAVATTDRVDCVGPAVGSEATSPGGNPNPGGSGTTVITVRCPAFAGQTQPFTAASIARGYVDAGTVRSGAAVAAPATDRQNPLQAAPEADTTVRPDLTSVTFQASTAANDIALFTFDEAIAVATSVGFRVYDVSGAETVATGIVSQTADARSVAVSFPNNTLNNAVGGSVAEGTVTGPTGTAGRTNRADEVGAAAVNPTATTSGRTAGPDLTGVTLTAVNDPFGQTTGYRATYVFDEDITAANFGQLFLYLADGTRLTCAGPTTVTTGQTAGNNNSVSCTNFTISSGTQAGAAATVGQVGAAVLGTVVEGAVTALDGAPTNPVGAANTTGGTGTPATA